MNAMTTAGKSQPVDQGGKRFKRWILAVKTAGFTSSIARTCRRSQPNRAEGAKEKHKMFPALSLKEAIFLIGERFYFNKTSKKMRLTPSTNSFVQF